MIARRRMRGEGLASSFKYGRWRSAICLSPPTPDRRAGGRFHGNRSTQAFFYKERWPISKFLSKINDYRIKQVEWPGFYL
ncbi:MAG TPA: hypothetical protein DIC59_15085 [Candidatus Competibacteraceae bacterium]|nr:hypothetical protein [Candidatus Competibacteraceae bacterium]